MSCAPLILTPASLIDRSDIFEWRNDSSTRRVSKNSDEISWATHTSWYIASLRSPDRQIYIGTIGSAKIGMIRFDRMKDQVNTLLVSIVIAPQRRGEGYGRALLAAGISLNRDQVCLAEIDSRNIASRRIFEDCGFVRTTVSESLLLTYRRDSGFSP